MNTFFVLGTRMHRVTDFDKRMLVWVKRYPSIADVPKDVTYVLNLYLYYIKSFNTKKKLKIEHKNINCDISYLNILVKILTLIINL